MLEHLVCRFQEMEGGIDRHYHDNESTNQR